MSRDTVNNENTAKQDITWDELISASESEISVCKEKIVNLRKSLVFFKKQKEMGIPFPLAGTGRHKKIS